MHEVALVHALIEQVEHEVRESGRQGRVTRLELVVGRLSGASPDALRFAVEVLAPGTLIETAQLHITEPCATCRCRECGASSSIEELVAACPQCHSLAVIIEGGRDLLLQSIELEEEEGKGQSDKGTEGQSA